ncbi:type III-A CRISPR-associated protein Csm2 [Desulfococcaceae bacterium HSG8]|nr:type III-A CRISPR-associated protein Csm2 [Desulfococcaceae bacterium HSG8]
MPNVFIDVYEKIPFDSILEELGSKTLFDQIDELPRYSAMIAKELDRKRISSTQLRRFYTYVKAVDQKNRHLADEKDIPDIDKAKLKFLLPKLAGSVKRTDKKKIEPLYRVFASCLRNDRIENVRDLRLFVEFFEAILDYHETYKTQ